MAPIVIDAPLSDSIRANKKNYKKTSINKTFHRVQKQVGGAGKAFGAYKSVGFHNGSTKGNQNVRVNISNLASTVTLEDLQELFTDFKFEKVSINSSQNGTPSGTGFITLLQKDAFRLMDKFKGVAIDGMEMMFAMSINSRVCFPGSSQRGAMSVKYYKPSGAKKSKAQKKQKRSPQRKMSEEELDAALEAYMS
ncbi:hypothetical protein CAEBREN_21990 [Caenorhabditis brenneri]|uniref:Uncharacterized protein n=1 Tax=Caenorhabditis brenneri TaxID=135651 RepID=G0NJ19_CAEBE|nr:hypothetical protein CAEBREN_21990 [Caenorhabditis brenneri]